MESCLCIWYYSIESFIMKHLANIEINHKMEEIIKIVENRIVYDNNRTSNAYLKEINIIENCPCDDCYYFATIITKLELEIFQVLKNVGVNLEKNLDSEPTGVWCIRDDNNEFVFFQQVYLIKGRILGNNSFRYEKEELGFKITAKFLNEKEDDVFIDLQVAKITK